MKLSPSLRHVALALVVISFAGACRRPNADAHLQKATAYVNQSRLPDAILEYRLALQADPKRGDIRLKLADALLRSSDGGNALKEYLRAADLLPNDATAQIKAGNILLLAGGFEDAKTRATKALALEPKNADAQILLGNAMAGLKDMDGAMAEYQEAVALDPNRDNAYLNIGAIQLVRGKRAEAEATFKKAIEVAPKAINARMALSNFYWASGRPAEAEQALKETLALDPSNLAVNRALGILYLLSNRAADAEPYFKLIAKTANTTAAKISLADYYAGVRRFDDARGVLKELATKEDAYAVATIRLAAIDAAQGDRAGALSKVRQVLDKYPKDMPARLLDARLLIATGKWDDALTQAQSMVKDEPNSALTTDAYLVIGGILTKLDRAEDAIKAYEQVLKRQAQPIAADLALAALHLAGGSLDKAATYAQQARTIQPANPLARTLIIRILLAQNDAAKAREELASLQKDFPSSATVFNLVAAQQLASKQVEAARASYAKALAIAPHDLEAMAGIVQIDVASGHGADAVKRVEGILKTTAPTGDFLMLAAQTYSAAGNAAKAEELLKQAIDLEPARLQAYGQLGGLYLRQNRLEDAKDQFKRVAEKSPTSIPANTMLGMLLEVQKRLPEAEQQYLKVLGIDSHAAVAANNLAWLYVASDRNLDKALELAQTAKAQLPDEPHVSDTLGWIYYKKNMASMAIPHLESSVRKDPSEPTSHYHLGMAYAHAGELEKARKELQQALTFKGEFDGAAEARKMLSQIGS